MLCYYFQTFDPKNDGFTIPEHFFGPLLPCVHPILDYNDPMPWKGRFIVVGTIHKTRSRDVIVRFKWFHVGRNPWWQTRARCYIPVGASWYLRLLMKIIMISIVSRRRGRWLGGWAKRVPDWGGLGAHEKRLISCRCGPLALVRFEQVDVQEEVQILKWRYVACSVGFRAVFPTLLPRQGGRGRLWRQRTLQWLFRWASKPSSSRHLIIW